MNRDVVESVAAFLGISAEELLERHDNYLPHQLARWRRLSPDTAPELADFYNDNLYLCELISTPRFGLVRLVEPFLRPQSAILDYGCGIGTHGLHFLQRGHRVAFVDVPSPHFDYVRWCCSRSGLAAQFAGTAAALPDKSFDAVLCFDVLEHVIDWRDVIRHFSRLLKADGKLFLIVSFLQFEEHAIHISSRTGLTEQSLAACMAQNGLTEIFRRDRPVPLSDPLEPFRVFARAPSESISRMWRLFEEGEARLREGSLAAAERCFAEVVAWNPQDFAARRSLARIFLGQGRLAEAAAEAGAVLELLPEDVGALEIGADLCLQSGDRDGALRRYAEAVAAWREHASHSKRMLGSLLDAGHSFEAACAHIDDWRKLQSLLASLIDIGRFKEAAGLAARLTARHPPESYAGYLIWKEYARLLRQTGRSAEAIDVLKRLVPHHRDRLWLHFDLSLCYSASGNTADALAALDEEERRSPFRSTVLFEKATVARRHGDLARAMALFAETASLAPQNGFAFLERGRTARRLGERALALSDFRRVTALIPGDAQVHFERGELEWSFRHYWKAVVSFEAAYRLDPGGMWPRFSFGMKLLLAARELIARDRRQRAPDGMTHGEENPVSR